MRAGLEPQRLGRQQAAEIGEGRRRVERSGSATVDERLQVQSRLLGACPDPGHVHQCVLDADRSIEVDEIDAAVLTLDTDLHIVPLRGGTDGSGRSASPARRSINDNSATPVIGLVIE